MLGVAPRPSSWPLDGIRRLSPRRNWALELEVDGTPGPWRLRCSSKEDQQALLTAIREQLGDGTGTPSSVAE